MADELSAEDAATVYSFYQRAQAGEAETARLMIKFSVFDDTPEDKIVRACKLFFADKDRHIARAIGYERLKAQAEELKRKKEAEEREESIRGQLPSEDELKKMSAVIPLGVDDIRQVADALFRSAPAVTKFTKPAQLHLFTLNCDWGDLETSRLIANSKLCDKGTALCCAWRTDCMHDAFPICSKHEADNFIMKECDLIMQIHEHWASGYYGEMFRYDPRSDDWGDLTIGKSDAGGGLRLAKTSSVLYWNMTSTMCLPVRPQA
jgi:hypothetical protein